MTSTPTDRKDFEAWLLVRESGKGYPADLREAWQAARRTEPVDIAALRKDALRYRWLRNTGFQHADVDLGTDFDGDPFVRYRIQFTLPEPAHRRFEDDEWQDEDIDAAIDAALAAQGEQK